ncbi:MAG: YqhA family protein [Chloroflexaceae bacterium]|nr:YqhA family protein [Chloroflexaceae bacterium]
MGRVLSYSRYIVLLGVVACVVVAATLFLAGMVRAGVLVVESLAAIASEKTPKTLSIATIELADIFLIATAIYIVGVGLYELFIGDAALPEWLVVKSLDDLKDKLISVVVVVLGVSFLAQVAVWDGQTNLLPYGAAIGAVILSLTAFGLIRRGKSSKAVEEMNGK